MNFARLKFLVHATGKYEQETVLFVFAHENCPHCRQEYHNTGSQVSWIARDAGCGMYGNTSCCNNTVVNLVFLFWFTEHITAVS